MENSSAVEKEQIAKVNKASFEAALKAAVSPSFVNRFELIPMPDGSAGYCVLVLGSALAGEKREKSGTAEAFVHVKMEEAFAINRNISADIAVRLQAIFGLTAEEMEEARKRNKPDGDMSG